MEHILLTFSLLFPYLSVLENEISFRFSMELYISVSECAHLFKFQYQATSYL